MEELKKQLLLIGEEFEKLRGQFKFNEAKDYLNKVSKELGVNILTYYANGAGTRIGLLVHKNGKFFIIDQGIVKEVSKDRALEIALWDTWPWEVDERLKELGWKNGMG